MRVEFGFDADGTYQCNELNRFSWQKHGFGSRLGNPQADVTLRQIHSDIVIDANGIGDREREGDALITDIPGLRIGVRTADCVPILLIDSVTHAVAAVHAGWRGTAAGILAKTIQELTESFGVLPQNLLAAIGPCIRHCCYEVGPDVARQFVSFFPEWIGEVSQRTIDLPEANRRQLIAAGVSADAIFDGGLCTVCAADRLFSYRREPQNPGRMLASISRLT